tara:strand:+ start:3871 stop:4680 length:810 start_codon:yes stop_codon:yes gene_type:complete
MLLYKLKIIIWYTLRPSYWEHCIELLKRKLIYKDNTLNERDAAIIWAKSKETNINEVYKQIKQDQNLDKYNNLSFNTELINEGKRLINKVNISIDKNIDEKILGGNANIDLLYTLTIISKPQKVIETGVAFGWSSYAILAALSENEMNGSLISVDMPYPSTVNNDYVGIVVPEKLRKDWKLIRLPDRPGIKKAIKINKEKFDLIHYDSDKSSRGRKYAYELLWESLKEGGLFISDDIEDNLEFANFVEKKQTKYFVLKYEKKYIGIAFK